MAWDDILAEMAVDDADKPVIEKYKKQIEGGYLRQSDYSRQSNALKEKVAQADYWDNWVKDEWDPEAVQENGRKGMTKAAKFYRDEAETLRTRVAELQEGAGGDMTFAEIEQELAKNGYVKKTDLEGVLRVTDLEKQDSAARQTLSKIVGSRDAGLEYMYAHITPLVNRYSREFGEDMTASNITSLMQFIGASEERLKDPAKAYEDFTSSKRTETALKQDREKLATERKEFDDARKKAEEDAATKHPASTDEGLGHMQRRQRDALRPAEGEQPDLSKARLGGGDLAQAGLEAFKSGKLKELAAEMANQ